VAWLLATDAEGPRQYWTGREGPNGGPQRTLWKGDAFHFTTPRAAYESAETHECLRRSEEWKAVRR
jgi:hypothetical protein